MPENQFIINIKFYFISTSQWHRDQTRTKLDPSHQLNIRTMLHPLLTVISKSM
jgi:hypothetical protein